MIKPRMINEPRRSRANEPGARVREPTRAARGRARTCE
jgi:hypothetical protein